MHDNSLLFGLSFTFFLGASLIGYLLGAYINYKLALKAGLKSEAWLAFIPVIQCVIFFHIIDKSAFNLILLFIPFVNVILTVIWGIEFLKRFGFNPLWILIMFISPLNAIFCIYMAFSSNVRYIATNKYQG